MPARGVIRDILMIFLGYKLLRVWLLNEDFTILAGALTITLVGFSVWFLLERVGVV